MQKARLSNFAMLLVCEQGLPCSTLGPRAEANQPCSDESAYFSPTAVLLSVFA